MAKFDGKDVSALAPEEVLAGGWTATQFRGAKGSWLSKGGPVSVPVKDPGWILLEGNFFEGVDQITNARVKDTTGMPLTTATDINVEGRAGAWRLAIECRRHTKSPLSLAFAYALDVTRGPFCTSISWVPRAQALVTTRWMGITDAAAVPMPEVAALPAVDPSDSVLLDAAVLDGEGLRSLLTFNELPERWTDTVFSLSVSPPQPGWWAVELSGRNCLGYSQLAGAVLMVNGTPASSFFQIRQSANGLGWLLSTGVHITEPHQPISLKCQFGEAEAGPKDDPNLGAVLNAITLIPARTRPVDSPVMPFAGNRLLSGEDRTLRENIGAGLHVLTPPSPLSDKLEVSVLGSTLQDYVVASHLGATLVEVARRPFPGGVRFTFWLPSVAANGTDDYLISVNRSSYSTEPCFLDRLTLKPIGEY